MPIGTCPLCLRGNQEIQDSHYFPSGAYKLFRAESLNNPNPIAVWNARMSQTSYQVHDFMLCWDCEQLLSRRGEDWLIPQLADKDGFPLLQTLHSATATQVEHDLKVYACARVKGIDCDSLAHFGMGVFWKGHAHQWPNCERLDFGRYGEPIRKFLRAEGPFPKGVALIIMVADMEEPPWFGSFPRLAGKQLFHLFNFYLSGISFCLAVGNSIPFYLREMCFCHNPERPLMAGLDVGPDEVARMQTVVRRCRPSQKLAEFLRGPNPRRALRRPAS